jgi:hypothetical protein
VLTITIRVAVSVGCQIGPSRLRDGSRGYRTPSTLLSGSPGDHTGSLALRALRAGLELEIRPKGRKTTGLKSGACRPNGGAPAYFGRWPKADFLRPASSRLGSLTDGRGIVAFPSRPDRIRLRPGRQPLHPSVILAPW